MAKFKFPKSKLTEFCDVMRQDMTVAGYTYQGSRVFVVVAKSRQEADESMKSFIERSCK